MAGFTMNEWIKATPTTVFEFLTNTENAPKISKNFVKMEKLTEGPVAVGTKYRETRLINGNEAETELEVSIFESAKRYSVMNETEGVLSTYHYTLVPEDDGTRIKLECDVTARGLKKAMTPIVASILKKEDANHLQSLKAAIEGKA